MTKLNVFDLFSGIGGFSLGLERTGGFETVAFCEIAEYPRQVLEQHWPDVPKFKDIHHVTAESIRDRGIGRIDVVTAGFPCQPFSSAGKQRGTSDDRHLWPELYRVIRDIRPRYIILENVPNLLRIEGGRVFGTILGQLASIGYDAEWQVLSAAAFGANHLRKRLWIVAYPNRIRQSRQTTTRQSCINCQRNYPSSEQTRRPEFCQIVSGSQDVAYTSQQRCKPGCNNREKRHVSRNANGQSTQGKSERDRRQSGVGATGSVLPDTNQPRLENRVFSTGGKEAIRAAQRQNSIRGGVWETESDVCRVVDGLPDRVDRIKALGNAIVPQVIEFIGYQILEFEKARK